MSIRLTQYTISPDEEIPFRRAHIDQLRFYLDFARREGVYYGNKGQFLRRETEIKDLLKKIQPTHK